MRALFVILGLLAMSPCVFTSGTTWSLYMPTPYQGAECVPNWNCTTCMYTPACKYILPMDGATNPWCEPRHKSSIHMYTGLVYELVHPTECYHLGNESDVRNLYHKTVAPIRRTTPTPVNFTDLETVSATHTATPIPTVPRPAFKRTKMTPNWIPEFIPDHLKDRWLTYDHATYRRTTRRPKRTRPPKTSTTTTSTTSTTTAKTTSTVTTSTTAAPTTVTVQTAQSSPDDPSTDLTFRVSLTTIAFTVSGLLTAAIVTYILYRKFAPRIRIARLERQLNKLAKRKRAEAAVAEDSVPLTDMTSKPSGSSTSRPTTTTLGQSTSKKVYEEICEQKQNAVINPTNPRHEVVVDMMSTLINSVQQNSGREVEYALYEKISGLNDSDRIKLFKKTVP